MPDILGEENKDKLPGSDELSKFNPVNPLPKIIHEQPAPKPVHVPLGYYVLAYKVIDEEPGAKFHYVALDTHATNLEKFINDDLRIGFYAKDIQVVEKANSFSEALSICVILRTEEHFGFHPHLRLGGILKARYTWKEIWDSKTKLKKYNT